MVGRWRMSVEGRENASGLTFKMQTTQEEEKKNKRLKKEKKKVGGRKRHADCRSLPQLAIITSRDIKWNLKKEKLGVKDALLKA
jgi:hypothetical protein